MGNRRDRGEPLGQVRRGVITLPTLQVAVVGRAYLERFEPHGGAISHGCDR